MLIFPKMTLWWHFSNIERSITSFEIILRLLQNIRSMQENKLFAIWIGLLIICLYPADDVRVSSAQPFALVMSLLHHFEHLALKS